MTPVAAYLRISEPRAVERWSLPAQRDAIAAHCARLGWGEPVWFVEEGRSAISDDYARRPQFRALLAAAEARQFRTVVVVDVDRFARSTLAGLAAAARLERAGCAVVSLNQGDMDLTTPDGEMKFTMHLMVARYESRQKGRRVRAAIARIRAEGRHYGSLPFGGALDASGRLVVDPARADLLARILRDVAATSYSAVARALTAEGIPPPGAGRDPAVPFSGHWWPSTLSQLVRAGGWLASQPEPWPARWLAAVGRRRQPKIRAGTTARMLTGLLRCRCGNTLTYGARDRRGGHYAQCFSRRLRPGGSGCPHPHTSTAVYERQVLDQLAALPDPAPTLVAMAGAPADLAAWRELDEDRRRLREAYRARLYTDAEFEAERRQLEARAAALPRAGGVAVTWGEFAALRAAIPGLPPAEQNAALRLLIDHVAVDGRVATVAWHAAIRVACGLPEPGPPTP